MTDELDIPLDHGISSVFSRNDVSLSTIYALIKQPSLQSTCHKVQLHFHHRGSDLMHNRWFPDLHHSSIEMPRVIVHSIGSSFPHPQEMMRTSHKLIVVFMLYFILSLVIFFYCVFSTISIISGDWTFV